ncbi:choline/carnitine/betaine transport [Brevibacterium sanguinis]|uniref:Choline/carnitine/betaine transport n=2 Tax=Brevibacterium TaxID=1696 RepID=A0A366IIN1_9MICO|nr:MULTISPECIES: BCCT family transporter [Brevibacterium]RBP64231.1 choline/carnitine/betaine transport [Brevibacterium sanguinis]RBP71477.1 choline/carnitine/betaine transport [Brevibacterium celere]
MAKPDTPRPDDHGHKRHRARKVLKEVTKPGLVHPALIPGIGVERTGKTFGTSKTVFGVAGVLIVAVLIWAFVSPESISVAGTTSLTWVTRTFGWLFGILAIAIAVFMLVVGYGRTGGIRLGADDEKPEFSTVSWVAMLFSAGIGIGLLFYGPYEPLTYFLDLPHGFEAEALSTDAMQLAQAQTLLHWGPIAWAFYALVGGSIAYSAYRRGRAPLFSSLFEPIFGAKAKGPLGAIIDIFAIVVTLFGTAISLGIGALQIGRGVEVVAGVGPVGNGFLIGTMAVLTVLFILSAVSGIKRGIRALSNINMVIAGTLALFVFIAGPTVFLLTFMPAALAEFVGQLPTMVARNAYQSPETGEFMSAWTTYYWAWWVSWSPFVGLFIAKISRGRTLREFTTVVVLVPSGVCFVWFGIFGGTSMWMESRGQPISEAGSPEAMLFEVLSHLPLAAITPILAMASIVVFFVTSADSASIVMGSLSQRGKPEPSRWVTITWGVLLGLISVSLLIAGGENALSGLQSIMVDSALPFAFVVIGIMFAWWKDLRTDPYILRSKFAQAAIAQGVRRGIEDHGDDFVFNATEVAKDEGAGAGLDTEDPTLTEWYLDATGDLDSVHAEDVRRTLEPGRIQKPGGHRPGDFASGDESLTTAHTHPDD